MHTFSFEQLNTSRLGLDAELLVLPALRGRRSSEPRPASEVWRP